MKAKTYHLKTINDVAEVVTKKNLQSFLKDFEAWLTIGIETKEANIPNMTFLTDTFHWNDDGKSGIVKSITIKIENES